MAEKTNLGEFFRTFNLGDVASGNIKTILGTLAAFGDPRMNAILQNLSRDVNEQTGLAARGAATRGAALGQDISAAIGGIGAGSTGLGAIGRGIGSSLAGSQASEAMLQGNLMRTQLSAQIRSQFLGQMLGLGGQLGAESAFTQLGAFTGIRQGELGKKSGPESIVGMLSSLGMAAGSLIP